MGSLSWWHWLIIGAAFILVFGAKKLPDAARGVGRSLRILKTEVAAMNADQPDQNQATPTTEVPTDLLQAAPSPRATASAQSTS
jgi:sec-independent protein translocase protein TatA